MLIITLPTTQLQIFSKSILNYQVLVKSTIDPENIGKINANPKLTKKFSFNYFPKQTLFQNYLLKGSEIEPPLVWEIRRHEQGK